MIKSIAIIPARYASTRLPGKPLADICGKPLIQRVWESASRSRELQRIVIATDDERIAEVCFEIGAECVLTPSDLNSGTDRALYAYNQLEEDADIVLNIQGDEPFLTGEIIDELIREFSGSSSDVGTIIKKIETPEELDDPSVVKVVLRSNQTAFYFSRCAVPFVRDDEMKSALEKYDYWKHIGVYAYKIDALKLFAGLEQSSIERMEKLEQLRLLEQGAEFFCMKTDKNLIGVDTPEDLEAVRRIICPDNEEE
jgi:3-deoxy-manno-octulosonate cytidylyltransferase (CMP-KDO synthetase)